MLQPLNKEQVELIKRYEESHLNKDEFCLTNNIIIHQLDYLIYKQKRIEKNHEPMEFVKVDFKEKKEAKLLFKIGICSIELNDSYDEELLQKTIRTISNVKL